MEFVFTVLISLRLGVFAVRGTVEQNLEPRTADRFTLNIFDVAREADPSISER